MENPSKFFDGAARSASPLDGMSPQSPAWRTAEAAYRELQAIGLPRVNLLLMGSGCAIDYLLDLFQVDQVEPISTWDSGEPLVLPAAENGTIVLRDVGDLTIDDQHRLLAWLNFAMGRTQVISTTSRSLLPQIADGTFNDTLYYRLNTVSIDLGH